MLLAVEIAPVGLAIVPALVAYVFCRWGWWRMHETRLDGTFRDGDVVTPGDWAQKWVPTAALLLFALALAVVGFLG